MNNKATGKVDVLTSLRFFAALAIVCHHAQIVFKFSTVPGIRVPLDWGVSFFFVLSGFILTYVYADSFRWSHLRDFYAARFARIWPLHCAGFILVLLLIPPSEWTIAGANPILEACTNLICVHAWIPVPAFYFAFNSVSWSISTEFFFYLAFPLLAFGWNRTWHWKAAIVFLLVGALLTFSDILKLPPYDPSDLSRCTLHGIAYISPFARIAEFVTGMLAARLFAAVKGRRLFAGVMLWTCLELAAIYAVIWSPTFFPGLPAIIFGPDNPMPSWTLFLVSTCGAPAFALLILICAIGFGGISRLLSNAVFVRLGEISFAMYLVHQPLIRWLAHNREMFGAVPDVWAWPVYLSATLILSHLLWSFVEMPCRKWLRSSLCTADKNSRPQPNLADSPRNFSASRGR